MEGVIMAYLNDSRGFFTSAKSLNPIPVESDVFRDALIRASLDPAVRSIEKMPAAALIHNLAVVVREDGRFAYGADGDARSIPSLLAQALEISQLRPLLISMQELYREPAISNDRLIWSHKARRVSNGIQTEILEFLSSYGPATLRELVSTLRLQRRSETSVLSMACSDLIEIDELAVKPFGLESIVRCRSASSVDEKFMVKRPIGLRSA
jgi:hypothetical protein